MRTDIRQRLADRDLDRSLVRWFMKQVGNPRISVRLWNGDEFNITSERPVACMEFRNRRVLFEMLRSPSIGFGENYARGSIDIHGDFLAFVNEISSALTEKREGSYYLPRLQSLLYALRVNTMTRSHNNVHHHYDLGNEFYKLWLDERMVYTCAYYDRPEATLAEAQVAKLDHVCRKLQLRPGQKVIEAGCGWGALAMHMAENYDVNVLAYNNSREQVAYARAQARERGLDDRVTFVEEDYRKIEDRCDVFVSVGMLEHVGRSHYKTLGALIKRSLKPEGYGLIHTIGRSYPAKMDPWIVKHIFPGGHAPSLSEMMAIFEPFRFSVLDVENLRLHYARTCEAWYRNFETVFDQVKDMYSKEFARMWRLYLAGSSAGFQAGTLQLFQVLFAPRANNAVPRTREYQFRED